MIRVVLWDVDNTLLDFHAAERASIRACFRRFGLGECTDEMLSDYAAINICHWEKLERGERTRAEILTDRFREFLSKYGKDPGLAVEFDAAYENGLPDTIVFFDGAMEVLQSLRGRVIQCAVTNGTKFVQERKLARSGMDRIFDHVFISEDVGYEKPDIRYFESVFSAIGDYPREEIMIVGDSITSDMRGGVNAGIVTCWFNPKGKKNTSQLPVDHEISALPQVLTLLG